MDKEILVGFLTSDSLSCTTMKSMASGGYNQLRAHGLGVCDLVKELNANSITTKLKLVDIGESKLTEGPQSADDVLKVNWDMGMHMKHAGIPELMECTMEEYLNQPGLKLLVMLYTYVGTDNKEFIEYLDKYLHDDRLHGILYYASDDEMHYEGYFLEGLLRDEYNRDPWLRLGDLKSKILMILSGHAYCMDYTKLVDKCYHAPMYLNQSIIDYVDAIGLPKLEKRYDYFINVFHDSRILDPYLKHCDETGKTMRILTNDVVGKYLKDIDKRHDVIITSGRNVPLPDLLRYAAECETYLIPNTYKHLSTWYNDSYVQDIMYTHKFLECLYIVSRVVGDVTHMSEIVSKSTEGGLREYYSKSPLTKIISDERRNIREWQEGQSSHDHHSTR